MALKHSQKAQERDPALTSVLRAVGFAAALAVSGCTSAPQNAKLAPASFDTRPLTSVIAVRAENSQTDKTAYRSYGVNGGTLSETIIYQHYKVNGESLKALRKSILENSPNPGRMNGETTWSYFYSSDPTSHKVTELSYEIVISLPKVENASREVSHMFNRFYEALLEHEEGHARIFEAGVEMMAGRKRRRYLK